MTSYPARPYEASVLLSATGRSEITGDAIRDDEDCQIVKRLQCREQRAMADLYDKYGGLLYSVILRSVKDQAVAEDLVQEVMLRVWNRIGQFDICRGRLAGWLVTIARNRAIDQVRSARSRASESTTDWTECERFHSFVWRDTSTDRLSVRRSVSTALSLLNSQQREILELTHFEGLTQTEIAERLHKPLGTVKSLVRSAVKTMRTYMQSQIH